MYFKKYRQAAHGIDAAPFARARQSAAIAGKINQIAAAMFMVAATAMFAACAPSVRTHQIQVPEGDTVFFSLTTGRPVAGAHVDWDLAFGASGTIYTNSGSSATTFGGKGQGGAWALGIRDIATVRPQDISAADYEKAATADVRLWVQVFYEGEPWEPAELRTLNSFMYLGYRGGAGTEADPLRDNMDYNSSNYYSYSMGSHGTDLTGQVYLVRHGDGQQFSLVQITGRVAGYPNRVFEVKTRRL